MFGTRVSLAFVRIHAKLEPPIGRAQGVKTCFDDFILLLSSPLTELLLRAYRVSQYQMMVVDFSRILIRRFSYKRSFQTAASVTFDILFP